MSIPSAELRHTVCAVWAAVACAGTAPSAKGHGFPGGVLGGTEREGRSEAVRGDAEHSNARFSWRFRLGSTVHASPAVGADGTVYVGSGDGLLFAVGPEGTLSWSFTLEGAVAEAPVLDQEGHILVATFAARLYSFTQRGVLSWQTRLASRATTGLVISPAWGLLFGGQDGALWAYSSHATALFHVPLGETLRVTPRAAGHLVWVGTEKALILLDGATKRARVDLGGPIESLAEPLPNGAAVAIAGGALHVVTTAGSIGFRRPGVAWAKTIGDEIFAAEQSGTVVRLGSDGAERAMYATGVRSSEPPLVLDSGRIYVPGESGNLAVIGKDGTVRRIALGNAALHTPVYDPARRRVIVAAGDGTLSAVPEGA